MKIKSDLVILRQRIFTETRTIFTQMTFLESQEFTGKVNNWSGDMDKCYKVHLDNFIEILDKIKSSVTDTDDFNEEVKSMHLDIGGQVFQERHYKQICKIIERKNYGFEIIPKYQKQDWRTELSALIIEGLLSKNERKRRS